MRSQTCNKSWTPWEISNRKMKNIDASKSEFGKKPEPSKNDYTQKPESTKIVFGRKCDRIKHVLWKKSRPPGGPWKSMHKPTRSCAQPIWNCEEDAPPWPTPFPSSDSLIQNRAKTLSEVRERTTTHIEEEEVVLRKNGSSRLVKSRYKESSRDRSSRVQR